MASKEFEKAKIYLETVGKGEIPEGRVTVNEKKAILAIAHSQLAIAEALRGLVEQLRRGIRTFE